MPTKTNLKICIDCKWRYAFDNCGHPEQADLVTGAPTPCASNREWWVEPDSSPPIIHCGPEGSLFEPRSKE